MILPGIKRRKESEKNFSLRLLVFLAFFLMVGVLVCTPLAIAQEDAIKKDTKQLHTYSLEEVVMAALKQNPELWQAELEVGQADARLLAERGATELQGFIEPVFAAGSLRKLQWAEKAIIDKDLRTAAVDELSWEGGIRVGFSKPLPTGGLFSLRIDWALARGFGGGHLGSELYLGDLSSEITWRQPLGRETKSMDPWWKIEQAEDTYTKAKLAKDASTRDVIIEVTDRFFEVVQAQEQLEVALQALDSVEEQQRVVEDKVSRGMGGAVDLRTAEIEVATASHAVSESRRRLDLARHQLSHATGLSLSSMTRLLPPPPVTWDTTLDVAIARGLNSSAELKILEIELDSAKRVWRRARDETKPRFDTSISVDQSGAWRVGVDVTWSFWDGQTAEQGAEAAALELQKANARLETMTEETKLLIRGAHYEYLASKEKVELAELKFARAEEVLESTRRRYALRMATELEMMDVLNQLREAKAEQAVAVHDQTAAAIRMLVYTDQLIRVFPNMTWGQESN